MKKKLLILISIPIIGIIIYYGFLFLAISWLNYFSNPHRKELTTQEIELFNELKNEYIFRRISRTPELEKEYKKDSLIYTIYMYDFSCNNKNSLDSIGKSIIKKANKKLELESKFYNYEIIIYCDNIQYREHLTMNRDSLNKGLYK